MHEYLVKERKNETQFQNIDSAELMKEFDFDKLYPTHGSKAKTAQMQDSRIMKPSSGHQKNPSVSNRTGTFERKDSYSKLAKSLSQNLLVKTNDNTQRFRGK